MNLFRVVILISFLAILALGIRFVQEGPGELLLFEAESGEVVANFWIVEDSSASGGHYARALRQGLSNDAVADLDFPVTVRQSGTYSVWARVYWPNSCANSVIFSLLRGDQAFFTTFAGHDAVFERWHWVRGQAPAWLDPGDYTLRLSIAEWTGIVDVILLSSDESFRPDAGSAHQAGGASVDMRARWVAEGGASLKRGDHLVLSGSNNPTILHPDRTFGEGLRLSARLRADQPTAGLVRLLFDVTEDGRARTVELGAGRCRFVSVENGQLLVLSEAPAEIDWSDGVSHSVVLERAYGRLLLWLDDSLILDAPSPLKLPGKVGFGASEGVLHIEEVMCIEREPIELSSNFDVDIFPLGVAQGWTPVTGLWERSELREYPEVYMVWGTGSLLATAGLESWDDYLMTCALSVSEDSEAGLVLRSLGEDSRVEVTLRPGGSKERARLRLTEKTEAGPQILGEAGVELSPGEWCLLGVQARGPELRVWLNGLEMLRCNVRATHGQVGLIAFRERPCPARFPLHPLYFLDGGQVRQMEIPLKVTSAATEMGVYFDRSPQSMGVVRIEYSDPARALLQALRMKRDSVAVLATRTFDLSEFIKCPVGDPPPQLPVNFLIEGAEAGIRARVTSGPREIRLPDLPMHVDPNAEVGIYDRTLEPAARFDDVLVTGLPYDVVRAGQDSVLFTFNTNYHDGSDLASWRPSQGVWMQGPSSDVNLVSSECLVGVVRTARAAVDLRNPVDSEGIAVSTGVYLPRRLAGKAALEIAAAGEQTVRLYLEQDSRGGRGRRYRLEDESGTVAEGALQAGGPWTKLALKVGPDGVVAAVGGRRVGEGQLIRPLSPFRVSLIVEGHPGARAHFDEVTIVKT